MTNPNVDPSGKSLLLQEALKARGLYKGNLDNTWGPQSDAAYQQFLKGEMTGPTNLVFASSFADPRDIQRFKTCKATGRSDQECFKVGDNGIGCWGDDVTEGSGPSVALPPEVMELNWGSVNDAKHQKIKVIRGQLSVICLIKDRMPHVANITNGCRIDLNPDACKTLQLTPPVMESVSWTRI